MSGLFGPVDDALGDATQGVIDVAQDGANAGADIGLGTTEWLADGTAEFGGALTDLGGAAGSATTEPLLSFVGLGGGGGGQNQQRQQNQNQNPDRPQGVGGIPPVLLIGGAAVALLLFIQMGD